MAGDGELMVGVDICADYTQLTYFDPKRLLPESVCRYKDEEQYLIPTRLALKLKKHEWVIGDEAKEALDDSEEETEEVKDFLKFVSENKEAVIGGESYGAGHLIQIFVRRLLYILNTYYPYNDIKYICFTFERVKKELAEAMADMAERLALSKDKYCLLNHDEALLYYTLNQKRELRINDTAMFELNDDGMYLGILEIDDSTVPVTAKMDKKYINKNLTRKMVEEDRVSAATVFGNLAVLAVEKKIISTIYATGRGFCDSWADKELSKLSPGRHVFRGQNLFAKGACFEARNRNAGREEEVIFLGEDRISAGVSIIAVKDGKEQETLLVAPTLKWYEAETSADVIVRGEEELSIKFKDFVTKKITQRFLSLSGINTKKSGITRIRLNIKFKDKDTCIVKASDLGFGSFVPTTNRVWELVWEK